MINHKQDGADESMSCSNTAKTSTKRL